MNLLDLYSPENSDATLGFAQGLLGATGWQRTPVSLGQALGLGLQGMNEGRNDYLLRQVRQQQLDAAKQQAQYRENDAAQANLIGGMLAANPNGKPFTATDINAAVLQGPPGSVQQEALKGILKPRPGKFGITPLYTRDANGNLQAYQLNTEGGASPIGLPPGISLAPPVVYKDSGGDIVPLSTRGGAVGPPIPKTLPPEKQPGNIQRNAEATAVGTQTGNNKAALPDALADIDYFEKNVSGLVHSPGFSEIYGAQGKFDPRNYVPGTDASNAQARLGQLDAASFGLSIQKMRGLGQLSDAEGRKVSAAFTRATDRKQSADAAKDAWQEVLSYLELARRRAANKAEGNYQPQEGGGSGTVQRDSVPEGVDPNLWQHMTPDERALWQK